MELNNTTPDVPISNPMGVNAGLSLSLDEMIKARQKEAKQQAKKKEKMVAATQRTPIKHDPNSKKHQRHQPNSAQKSIGSSKAKRNSTIAAKRGIRDHSKPTVSEIKSQISRQQQNKSSNKKKNTTSATNATTVSKALCSVYVGNLSYDTKWQALKDFMRQAGNVDKATILETNDGRSKGAGIVLYQNPKDAKRAIQKLNNMELHGRQIFVREDREEQKSNHREHQQRNNNCRVFVGNLPFDVSWQDLKDFMRQAGNVDNATILQGADGRSKGAGLVLYQHPKDADRAIRQLHGMEFRGRNIQVREDRESTKINANDSTDGNRNLTKSTDYTPETSVFVGNLAFDTSWQDLKDFMRQAGNVAKADIMKSPDGRSKGCGVVSFENARDAKYAITTLNSSRLGGREIFVQEYNRDKE